MQLDARNRTIAIFLVVATVGTVAAGVGVLTASEAETQTVQFMQNDTVVASATVEVAETPETRQAGLMNRTDLPDDHGMLFVYPDAEQRSFWMKNTYIPLDIIFLDEQRRVINVEQAEPEPDAPDAELERYRSDAPAQYVVEFEQGFARRHEIQPGTVVRWDRDS